MKGIHESGTAANGGSADGCLPRDVALLAAGVNNRV